MVKTLFIMKISPAQDNPEWWVWSLTSDITAGESCFRYGRSDNGFDFIYKSFDQAFRYGRFDEANLVLKNLEVEKLCRQTLNAIFTITFHAKDKLPNRAGILKKAKEWIIKDQNDFLKRLKRLE